MNLKKALTLMAAVSVALALTFEAEARPFAPDLYRGRGAGLPDLRVFLELKLSDSQQAEMMSVINKYQEVRESLRNNLIEARKNLMTVISSEQFNEEEARKAFRAASAVREEMFVLRTKMRAELKAVLTPAQLELLKERQARRLEKIRDRLDTWLEKQGE